MSKLHVHPSFSQKLFLKKKHASTPTLSIFPVQFLVFLHPSLPIVGFIDVEFFSTIKLLFVNLIDQLFSAHISPFFFLLNLSQNRRFWFFRIIQPFSVEMTSYHCTRSLLGARFIQFLAINLFLMIPEMQNFYSNSVFLGFEECWFGTGLALIWIVAVVLKNTKLKF